jgi:radical SAM superfamily enzyme YgiQ (UPF0313 family)
MKKVCFVNPPQLNSLDDRLDPPLGMMYMAAVLEDLGVDVSICDLASRKKTEWLSKIDEAEIYGMTLFSASLNTAREISRMIKERNKNALIVAGGPHATSLPNETLATGDFDYIITKEGEYAMPNLVERISKNMATEKIIQGPLVDVNSLPMPARHLVDINSYTREVEGNKATSIITSRGCPNNCSFCCKDIHGRGVRFRNPDAIIRELESIIEKYNIRSFIFYDDIFTLNRPRLKVLAERFKDMGISFRCNGRAGINTYEDYVLLKQAGCNEIAFGIESGSQKILNSVNKGTTVEQNLRSITLAKKAGLVTKAYLMVGYPGETQETIDETKKFMDSANPDKFTLFTFVPLPGCDVWRNPLKYGITEISKDWNQFFNIAGQYEGGLTFKTKELDEKRIKYLHDDLVNYLLNRKGKNYGQNGILQGYYQKIKV